MVTRAIFYCARMLSAQLDTEFTPKNYDDIKKVYSIWICMEVPQYAEYTITTYHMNREDLYGHVKKEARYDLLETVMICLGREEERAKGNRLHGMLSVLLSDKLRPEEKETILEHEYDIETSVELKGGIEKMCNLSDKIEERGIKQGTERTLFSLVKQGLLKSEDAARQLNMSVEDFIAKMEQAGQ